MIERQLLKQNKLELAICDFIKLNLSSALISNVKIQKTPLGEKIVVYCAKPGLIVGRKGGNVKQISHDLKTKFHLDNPQLEIIEVQNKYTDAKIVASMISGLLQQYGSMRFKGIAHKMMTAVMAAGAMGIEIRLSGRIPSAKAKSWRFYTGYLKKNGDVAISQVDKAVDFANLKVGTIGIIVKIMRGDVILPDRITFLAEATDENKTEAVAEKAVVADAEGIDIPADAAAENQAVEEKLAEEKKASSEKPKRTRKPRQPKAQVAEEVAEPPAGTETNAAETESQ